MVEFKSAPNQNEPSDKWIIVKDISGKATDESVKEFFAFCGKIESFEIAVSATDNTKEALIRFDSSSAANTARMLTSAVIADKPITVNPYFDQFIASSSDAKYDDSENEGKNASQANNEFDSFITAISSTAHNISEAVVHTASEIDRKSGLSRNLKGAVAFASKESKAIDEKLHITETARNVTSTIGRQAKVVDDKLHLSETARTVSSEIGRQAKVVDDKLKISENLDKAMQSEPVQKVSMFFQMVSSAIKETADSVLNTATNSSAANASPATKDGQQGTPLPATKTDLTSVELDNDTEELFKNTLADSPPKPAVNK